MSRASTESTAPLQSTSVAPRQPAASRPATKRSTFNPSTAFTVSLQSASPAMVHGILLARVPRCEVDDLVQDVFLSALRRLSSLRDSAAFGGWLAMIARNRANDYHRRSSDTVELPEDLAKYDPPEAEAMEALEVIRSLPEAYREPMILRLVEGMTGPEIAARTGLTP